MRRLKEQWKKMKKIVRAGIAGLALAAVVAAPISEANAGTPPPPVGGPDFAATALTGVWIVGFMLCTGMTFGRQDVLAAKAGTVVTGKDRWQAIGKCLLPPIGLAEIGK
jgi:hypothetical protein